MIKLLLKILIFQLSKNMKKLHQIRRKFKFFIKAYIQEIYWEKLLQIEKFNSPINLHEILSSFKKTSCNLENLTQFLEEFIQYETIFK